MLSILDKYIIKKFLGTFVFAIALIISIAVVFDINEKLDKFMRNDAPLNEIVFHYYMNFVPYYTNLFSPIFIFIAVIFFTSKMADNSEVIAMLSTGMSFKRMLRPYLISAAIISVSTFVLGGYIIPPANVVRLKFENRYIKKKDKNYANRVQLMVEPGVIAYMDRYNGNEKTGYQFSLDHFKKNQLLSRLTAKRIKYHSGYKWTVYNYTIHTFSGRKDKTVSGANLDTTIAIVPQDFVISANDAQQMTTSKLQHFVSRQKERGVGNVKDFEIEYYQRFAYAFSAFILTVIGASLSSRKIKGGMGLNLALGALLSVSYILFMTVSSSFAISGLMSPMIAVWIPNVIFSIIAFVLYTRAPN